MITKSKVFKRSSANSNLNPNSNPIPRAQKPFRNDVIIQTSVQIPSVIRKFDVRMLRLIEDVAN